MREYQEGCEWLSSSRTRMTKIFLLSLTNNVKDPIQRDENTHKIQKKQKPIEISKIPKHEKKKKFTKTETKNSKNPKPKKYFEKSKLKTKSKKCSKKPHKVFRFSLFSVPGHFYSFYDLIQKCFCFESPLLVCFFLMSWTWTRT